MTDPTVSPSPTAPVISCRGMHLSYGSTPVLRGLDLTVRPGRVHGLLGRNGAGKSTSLRAVLGLNRLQRGSVELFGRPFSRDALSLVGASIDGPALYGHLSAWDNLAVHARLLRTSRERVERVLGLVGLDGASGKRARSFSTGMKMRLALAIALLGDPPLLILDEPQNGLDPQGIVELRHLLRDRAAQGGTVLVSSHQLGEVSHLVDDITVIGDGRSLYSGPLAEFAPEGRLEEAFLRLTLAPDRGGVDAGPAGEEVAR